MAHSALGDTVRCFAVAFHFPEVFLQELSSLSSLKSLTVMQVEYKNIFIQLRKLLLCSLSGTGSRALPGAGMQRGWAIPRPRLPSAALPGNFSAPSSTAAALFCFSGLPQHAQM